MSTTLTAMQIKRWLDRAVKEATNPNNKTIIRQQRAIKKKKIAKKFGL